jgi:hypothetical protein
LQWIVVRTLESTGWSTPPEFIVSPPTPANWNYATNLATTGGDDPCVAYATDWAYSGPWYLRLQCASLSDRVIAPRVDADRGASLAMARRGARIDVVFHNPYPVNELTWTSYVNQAGPTEVIDQAERGAKSVAIGADGTTHIAYARVWGTSREIMYATRRNGTWTRELVDNDSVRISHERDSISIALVDDQPVIAYHHNSTRSLKLAKREASGFALRTLVTPPVGYPRDDAGTQVAMQVDCLDRLHLVYRRNFTTDQPEDRLWYAAITDTDFVQSSMGSPQLGTAGSDYQGDTLSFVVGNDGRQYVAVTTQSDTHVATR